MSQLLRHRQGMGCSGHDQATGIMENPSHTGSIARTGGKMGRIDAATGWSLGLWLVLGLVPTVGGSVGWHNLLNHQGAAAAWVQAVGSILAILGAFAVGRQQANVAVESILLQKRMDDDAAKLIAAEEDRDFAVMVSVHAKGGFDAFVDIASRISDGRVTHESFAEGFNSTALLHTLESMEQLLKTRHRVSETYFCSNRVIGTFKVLLSRLATMSGRDLTEAKFYSTAHIFIAEVEMLTKHRYGLDVAVAKAIDAAWACGSPSDGLWVKGDDRPPTAN